MSVYPVVKVVVEGERGGYIIASLSHPGKEDLPPSQQMHMGIRLVVGDVRRIDWDSDEREAWKAWLWPVAGGDMRTGQSCEAVEAGTSGELAEKIRERAAKGPWWR